MAMANRVLRVDVVDTTANDYNGARKQAPRVVMERKSSDIEGFIYRVEKGVYKLYMKHEGKYYVGDMGSYSPHDFVKFSFRKIQTVTTAIFDNPDFIQSAEPIKRENAA